ncbi:hypothetical protein [Paraburkholderia terricola]|uniref:hypothetical protein n=1 Tax=Paraburkholderia terricola TaxID=169427 RepID=UPI003ECCA12D
MTTDTDAAKSAMDQLSSWLRSEADRHMTSIAWRDPAISEHALNLRKWANEIDSRRAPTPSAQEEAVRLPVDVQAMLEACVPGGNICDPQSVADSIRAWLAEQAEAVRVPEGYALVPLKPTAEIVRAGGEARIADFNRNGTTLSVRDANRVAEAMYRAMIAAAPAASAGDQS